MMIMSAGYDRAVHCCQAQCVFCWHGVCHMSMAMRASVWYPELAMRNTKERLAEQDRQNDQRKRGLADGGDSSPLASEAQG
jgi:hypothetical protein